jgi:hypothetical protein
MFYQGHSFRLHPPGRLVTFCSCNLMGTELEQISRKREMIMLWAKDAAAGIGLVVFMAASFLFASGAHSLLSAF